MAFIKSAANGTLQMAALVLATLSTGLTIYIICSDQWMLSDIEGTVLESVRRSSGLFYKCSLTLSDSKDACEDYDKFFVSLSPAILGSRILTSIGLCLAALGVILLLLGASFTSFMAEEYDERKGYLWVASSAKAKVAVTGGVMMILAAILVGAAVSWFAALIVDQYHLQSQFLGNGNDTTGIRMVFGPAIWVGWSAMMLALFSGIIAIMSSCSAATDDEVQEYYKAQDPYTNAYQVDARQNDDYL